jgi:hypothetical protein
MSLTVSVMVGHNGGLVKAFKALVPAAGSARVAVHTSVTFMDAKKSPAIYLWASLQRGRASNNKHAFRFSLYLQDLKTHS